jgi:hypothetical protein
MVPESLRDHEFRFARGAIRSTMTRRGGAIMP